MLRKVYSLLLLLSFIIVSSLGLFANNVNAQINNASQQAGEFQDMWSHTWYSEPNPIEWYKKVYDPEISESEIFGERYTAAQVQWVMYGVLSIFMNLIPGNPDLIVYCSGGDVIKCGETVSKIIDGFNLLTNNESGSQNTFLSTFGRNQISGVFYIRELVSKYSLVQTVNAQGFGYNTAADSLRSMWQVTRNISYGFIVIATIILSFMIMFQIKINPQTVISIQSAIPKVIIAAVLITFSYAIAGFLIDLMYVFIGLIVMMITSGGLSDMTITELFTDITTRNAFGLLYSYWVHFVASAFLTAFSGGGMGILVFIVAILSILVILWWSLKIIFMIVKNFALLVITIVTGPLEIMIGVVTQSTGFNTWLRKMISYLAFYPVLAIMFFFAFFFLNQGDNAATSFATTVPFHPAKNFIGANSWDPPLSFLAVSGYRLIWILVSFYIFSEITKVAEIVQSFIAGKQWSYGSGISEVEKSVGDAAGKPALQAGAKAVGGWAKGVGTAAATAIKAAILGG